jgi:hypothetical protein
MSFKRFSLTNDRDGSRVSASSHNGAPDLNRPVSPLLHDYKPTSGQPAPRSNAARWFALGLGLPLIGVALAAVIGKSGPEAADVPPSTLEAAPAL